MAYVIRKKNWPGDPLTGAKGGPVWALFYKDVHGETLVYTSKIRARVVKQKKDLEAIGHKPRRLAGDIVKNPKATPKKRANPREHFPHTARGRPTKLKEFLLTKMAKDGTVLSSKTILATPLAAKGQAMGAVGSKVGGVKVEKVILDDGKRYRKN